MATPFAGEWAHNEIALWSCMLRSCHAERSVARNQPEPFERRAMKGLYKRTIFQIEASKAKFKDNLTEWLTTIEQCEVAK